MTPCLSPQIPPVPLAPPSPSALPVPSVPRILTLIPQIPLALLPCLSPIPPLSPPCHHHHCPFSATVPCSPVALSAPTAHVRLWPDGRQGETYWLGPAQQSEKVKVWQRREKLKRLHVPLSIAIYLSK